MEVDRGRWRRVLQVLAVGGVSTLALAACGSGSSGGGGSAKSPLEEAIVIAFTGAVSFEGGTASAGVYPAVYEINKDGGILGHHVKVVTEDTRGDPADAVPIVDKLLATANNLMGMDGPGTSVAPTVVPIVNSAHVTDMILGGNASFDRSHYKYMWRLVPPDPANGEAMALWAKDKGYTKVATVFGSDPGSQGDLPGVLFGLKKTGAKVVANVTLTPDQPSYRAEAEKVIAAHPQVIMTESDGTTGATFFAELKQLGGLVPIIGTTATDVSDWLNPVRHAIGASAFASHYSSLVAGLQRTTLANTTYDSALKAESSKVPHPASQFDTNPYSSAQYDGVIVQALAMNEAHSVKPTVYNKDIIPVTAPGPGKTVVYTYAQGVKAIKQGKKIQYIGAGGPIKFDKYHNSFGNQAAETVNANDKATVVKIITEKQIQALG